MPMKKYRLELRFVIYPEGNHWFAHSLEFDIVAEGSEPVAALVKVKEPRASCCDR